VSVVRRALWHSGLPARLALLFAIRVYRATLAGVLGGQCRFYPSCSRYAEDAIRTRGATVGMALATWRVLRCNPFGKGGVDPAPAAQYDAVASRTGRGVRA
jgi:putative membrane protein insertion efficiency factor